jgi:hypothetical protein
VSSSGSGSAKQPEWKKLYEAAVLELDRAVLPSRVKAARNAIQCRIVELRTSEPTEDDSRIDDAIKMLNALTKIYE